MLTSKPIYREKNLWSSSFLIPSKALELKISQLVACFWCPFSLSYVADSYGCYCSCCSYNTWIEEEKKVATTQERKKPASKRNPRT
jgi:hypothetical protein